MMYDDLRGKKLLVMGGTQISCEIIRKAQVMGCYVVVADYFPVEQSPGKQIADESFEVSVTDVDAVVALIHRERIDGVLVGFNDMLLPYYAEVCKKCGLPSYGTKKQFEIFTQKNQYKKLCRQFHVPTVEEYIVDLKRFEETTSTIQYPVMVKPADNSGSRGITVCNDKEQLKQAMQRATEFSETGVILVERYLEGREATVFWVFQDGKYYLTAIGNRHVKHNQKDTIPLPVGYTYPSVVLPRYREEIEEHCKEMFSSVGIQNGMMFMQCKIENGVCIVYDIGYRLTGSLEYTNLESSCGFNPLEMMIHFALTGKMANQSIADKVDPTFGGEYGFNVSCLSAPGTIKEIQGCKDIISLPEVLDLVIEHKEGETITQAMRGLLAQITVRILGTVQKKESLFQVMSRIESLMHIISTDGRELMLPGIEPEDIDGWVL